MEEGAGKANLLFTSLRKTEAKKSKKLKISDEMCQSWSTVESSHFFVMRGSEYIYLY